MNSLLQIPHLWKVAVASQGMNIEWTLSLQILIGVAIVQAWVIYRLNREIQRLQKALPKPEDLAKSESSLSGLDALFSKALTGSLDRFSMSEVIQFLSSIRETGILDIVDPVVSEVHRLVVKEGEIVDAFNGALRGEPAVRAIFACRKGHFTFIRGDVPSEERRVHTPTMMLLMESCKQADETGLELAPAI